MKKEFVLIAFLLLLAPLAYAAENESSVPGTTNPSTFEKADNLLEREMTITGIGKFVFENWFKLTTPITLTHIIIIIMLTLFLFVALLDMTYGFSPFSKATCVVMALIIVSLISLLGWMREVMLWLLNIKTGLERSTFIEVSIYIVIFLAGMFVFNKISSVNRRMKEREKEKEKAALAGAALGASKTLVDESAKVADESAKP